MNTCDENILAMSPEGNVVFVGKQSEYDKLLTTLKEFNKNGHKVYLDFCGPAEKVLFKKGDNNVYDAIKNILKYWYHKYDIEAEIKAFPFKNFKFENNEQV